MLVRVESYRGPVKERPTKNETLIKFSNRSSSNFVIETDSRKRLRGVNVTWFSKETEGCIQIWDHNILRVTWTWNGSFMISAKTITKHTTKQLRKKKRVIPHSGYKVELVVQRSGHDRISPKSDYIDISFTSLRTHCTVLLNSYGTLVFCLPRWTHSSRLFLKTSPL